MSGILSDYHDRWTYLAFQPRLDSHARSPQLPRPVSVFYAELDILFRLRTWNNYWKNDIFFHTRNWPVRPHHWKRFFSYTPGTELCILNLFLCSPRVYLTCTDKQTDDGGNDFSCLSITPRYHDQTNAIYKKNIYNIMIKYELI